MARGRKNYTLEEQLEQIVAKIAGTEELLAALNEQKAEIETAIKTQKLDELNTLIEESGMSFDEVKELLKKD